MVKTRKAKAHSLSWDSLRKLSPMENDLTIFSILPGMVRGYYHPRCTGKKLIQLRTVSSLAYEGLILWQTPQLSRAAERTKNKRVTPATHDNMGESHRYNTEQSSHIHADQIQMQEGILCSDRGHDSNYSWEKGTFL